MIYIQDYAGSQNPAKGDKNEKEIDSGSNFGAEPRVVP